MASPPSTSASNTNNSKITLREGDLFSAPPGSLLIHSCNCQGSWNSGVAAGFKKHFPKAYQVYRQHCLSALNSASSSPPTTTTTASSSSSSSSSSSLLGTTLLIPPQPGDTRSPYYIACLFTSFHYGKRVDPPEEIVKHTGLALGDLVRQVEGLEGRAAGRDGMQWHLPRINSLRFGVPWEVTMGQLEATGMDMVVWVYGEGEDTGKGVVKR